MRLDVIIATFNRRELLARALGSLAAAARPEGLELGVLVVDNNSSDGTAAVAREWEGAFAGRLRYLHEPRQGKAYALNTGVAAARGDLVGFLDDDEEVAANWLSVVREAFRDPRLDFIGGPYIPRWTCAAPAWLPAQSYGAVIGRVDAGVAAQPFGPEFPGILMGGNAVIRREVLARCGPYATDISRTSARLITGEDDEMYQRLLALGARGLYLPELAIYHHVLPERLHKSYFRKWTFWRGVGLAIQDRRRPSPVPHLAGVPRWYFRAALRGARKALRGILARSPAPLFEGELDVLTLAGLLYGAWRHRA